MNDIIVFESQENGTEIQVRVDGETVWLSQDQMADLFGKAKSTINEHIKNITDSGELSLDDTMNKFGISEFAKKPTNFYNLDMIISVGYRVNSKKGVQFRQWATRVLKEHLTQGWTLDRKRFESNAAELESAMALIRKASQAPGLSADTGRGLVDIVTRYAQTFLLLQRYDEGLLTDPPSQLGGTLQTHQEALTALSGLKLSLVERGEATDLFARERGDAFAALLGNLEQTIFGEPAYPTVEAKAAHLLYFVIKNHPFSDGNKRSGAFLFVDFLNRNGRLLDKQGNPIINDIGMAAIALLVAESVPESKETMIRLIMNMIAQS